MSDNVETSAWETPYQPPAVERVLTADELAREVQYAGLISVIIIDR